MSTAPHPESALGTPILEFLHSGQTVCAVYLRITLRHRSGALQLGFETTVKPVTRIGRTLPDWPRALSLRPDLQARVN